MDRYIPGVPCWIDTMQPDAQAATSFYGELFGWQTEDVMPPGAPGSYFMARLPGGDVAGIGTPPDGAPDTAVWQTYVWVDDADETAAKVRDAGGAVLADPMDVGDSGRMAAFADPDGAVFSAWQPKEHRGAAVVNEHGSLNFNDLKTRDVEGAAAFYGAVFGWELIGVGATRMWALPAYGDFLEARNPGTRARMAEMGGPPRFEEVVASATPVTDQDPHWGVTFAVDDADAIAARAVELGGRVLVGPLDAPWVRMAIVSDPQGATFTASQFVLENRDLPAVTATGA